MSTETNPLLTQLRQRAVVDPCLHQVLYAIDLGADQEEALMGLILWYSEEREKLLKMALDGEMKRPIYLHFNGIHLERRDD